MRVDDSRSFIQFVYPFQFDQAGFRILVDNLRRAKWQGRESALTVWKRDKFPEDDLLTHVASYLNPPEGTTPTAYLWQLDTGALESAYGLGRNADWKFMGPHMQVPFHIEGVQLSLFLIGVGFLTICAKPRSNKINDWQDFFHYFRFVGGQRDVRIQAQRRVGFDEQERQPQFAPFFPEPAGGIDRHPEGIGLLGEILDALLSTGSEEKASEHWWKDVFIPGQMIPFGALFADDVPDEDIAHMLYRMRNFFHSNEAIYPAAEDIRFDHPSLLTYAERQWFVFSLDGGAFVAYDAPDTSFFRGTSPIHLRRQYYLMFLLVLHQRFALMKLSEDVAKHWLSDTDREKIFERIQDALLSFMARGHFVQVMQRGHHHRCYRKWQETFQIEQLYQEVKEEVLEMHNYLQAERLDRLQRLAEEEKTAEAERENAAKERSKLTERRLKMLNYLAALLGIPALLCSFLEATGGVRFWSALSVASGGLLLGVLVLVLIHFITRRN